MVQKMVQPRLGIEYPTTWPVAQMILIHFASAKESPTFTIRQGDGDAVTLWMSKRTYDWLKRVLAMDPRAHKED
jgi:hypothetical protein